MKKLAHIIYSLLTLSFLTSCQKIPLDYSDIKDLHIIFSDVLQFQDLTYVYIYSPTCGHCKAIKEDVISFAVKNRHLLYFVSYTNEIKIIDDRHSLIGVDTYEELGVVGVPCIFGVEDKKITSYFLGGDEILTFFTFYDQHQHSV